MKTRIQLYLVEERIFLRAVIKCPRIHLGFNLMNFVIDTGSQESFISSKDVLKLNLPIKNREIEGEIDFGGSRFKKVLLPNFDLILLCDDNSKLSFKMPLNALKTTKESVKKRQIADIMPSILGMDFLRSQNLSLHVYARENLAYLEVES